MANLLHRLLRSRQPAPSDEAPPAESAAVPEPPAPRAEEQEAPPAPRSEPEPAERPQDDPSRFEAKPRSGRGRRKTSDEVSTIGPGEP